MEALSSFAISIAAGKALEVYNKSQGTVEKEIKKAFEKALKQWTPNTSIRIDFREALRSKLERNVTTPEAIMDLQSSAEDKFEKDFYIEFEKAIAEFTTAFNYLKEVKDLERFKAEIEKLTNIQKIVEDTNKKVGQLLENSLPSSNISLEAEWKRQIALYREDIEQLKPKSSLKHLKALEESFKVNDIQPSKLLRSYLEFSKAQCYDLLGKNKEASQSFIKANKLNPIPLEIKEKASISYTNLDQPKESLELANEILNDEEHNPIAWAVKVILSDEPNLEKRFEIVPSIVKKDCTFQRIVYFKTITDAKVQNKIPVYQDNGFLKEVTDYSKSPLTYGNYKDTVFFIETILQQWLSTIYFDFIFGSTQDPTTLGKIQQILSDFLDQLSSTEIEVHMNTYRFFNYYLNYLLNGTPHALKEMEILFPTITPKNDLMGMMLANSLQLSGNIDRALEAINSFQDKSFELFSLELFCLAKQNNFDNYAKTASDFLKGTNEINEANCDIVITILDALAEFKRLNYFEFKPFFEKVEADPLFLKILALNFYRILKGENLDHTFTELKSIEDEIVSEETNIRFFLPYCYFLLEEYDSAISCFERYLQYDFESRDFKYYIATLIESKVNNKKLLTALEVWRKNCSFNEVFLKIEIELNQRLKNWEKCLEVANFSLQVKPNDEWVLTAKILSISNLNLPDKVSQLEENITKLLGIGINDFNHVRIVANALIDYGDYQKARDLLYEKAKDPENIPARMEYFLSATKISDSFSDVPEKVGVGHYVIYSRKGREEEIKILKGNSIALKFIGKKVGEIVSIQDPITKELDNLEIRRIMDKYHSLHWEIIQQVEKSPYAGLPMHSFELPSDNPEALKEKLISLFGAEGSQNKDLIEKAIAEYYAHKISLTEVIMRVYRSEYFSGYFDLLYNRKGIVQLPLKFFRNLNLTPNHKFAIDFSSLIILHQITKSTDKDYSEKFLIANGIVQFIKSKINEEWEEPKEILFADITLEGIKISKGDQNSASNNISYYESVLDWVDKYCKIIITESKLDYESAINLDPREDKILFQLFVENVALISDDESRILISDDHIYYNISPLTNGQIISTEFYINHRLDNSDESIYELVKNRYIGLSISKELLHSEYRKKRREESNFFDDCLNNCALQVSGTLRTAKTVVEFLKEMALEPLMDNEAFYLLSNGAFIVLLGNQRHSEVFTSTKAFIEGSFQLLGEKYDIIKQSFADAVSIIKNP